MRMVTVGSILLSLMVAGAAWAAPNVQVKGGQSTLNLSTDFSGLLEGCETRRIKPTVVKPVGELIRFTVAGGVIDLEYMTGEIDHKGGIALSCDGGESVVSLQNLTVDKTGEDSIVTAMFAVNGTLHGRMPLFMLEGEPEVKVSNWNRLALSGVELTLVQEAADFLNEELGTGLFAGEQLVGDFRTRINLRLGDDDRDEEEEIEEKKSKDKDKSKDKEEEDEEEDGDEEEED